MDFGRTLFGLLTLMRPLEWSKSLGNMLIAVFVAGYLLDSAFKIWHLDWVLFLLGFVGVALLWSGLYALNDYIDREHDRLHAVKRCRPIPSGAVGASAGLVFAIVLLAIAFAIGGFVLLKTNSVLYIVCLVAMLINQLLYTLKPFELKKRAVLDMVSGSLVNPFFRFYAGWVLFIPAFNAPLDIIAFILLMQFGGYALYRLSTREHEQALGYRSSAVLLPERAVKGASYAGMALAGLAYLHAALFGTLPLRFILLVVLSLLAAPLYARALKQPQKIDMHHMYRVIYIHYLLFIAGFVVLFGF